MHCSLYVSIRFRTCFINVTCTTPYSINSPNKWQVIHAINSHNKPLARAPRGPNLNKFVILSLFPRAGAARPSARPRGRLI